MVNVLNSQIKLIGVVFRLTTVLRASVCEHTKQQNLAHIKERYDPRSLRRSAAVRAVFSV